MIQAATDPVRTDAGCTGASGADPACVAVARWGDSLGLAKAPIGSDPARLSASRRRSSDRVPPVRRASSGSMGNRNPGMVRTLRSRPGAGRCQVTLVTVSAELPRAPDGGTGMGGTLLVVVAIFPPTGPFAALAVSRYGPKSKPCGGFSSRKSLLTLRTQRPRK